jgi:hypothetical protein
MNKDVLLLFIGLPSAQISYIPAAVGLQTPTLTPAGEQRYFEYPLTPQPMPGGAGQLHRDSLLQRSKINLHRTNFKKKNDFPLFQVEMD